MTDRPLLISSSLPLIDEVVRLASASALEVHVAPDVAAATAHWLSAPLVIIGSDVALNATIPGRRARVVVAHVNDESSDLGAQRDMWRFAVEVGAEHVVELPEGERWLVDSLRECAEGPARNGQIVAVLGGSGGVGTSTLTVNLAVCSAQRGCRSLVVDADPWGGGLDLLVGAEDITGARWSDLHQVSGHLPAGHLEAALPRVADVSVLSCTRSDSDFPAQNTLAAVLAAGRRSHDAVFVDCSRITDDVLSAVITTSDSAVLLVGDHVRSTAAAARRQSWLRSKVAHVCVVSASTPRGISREDVAHALGVHVVTAVPHVPSMTIRADEGEMPALPRSYVQACEAILADIGVAGPSGTTASNARGKGRAA